MRPKAAFAATRETVGMTQTELARRMGVEVRSVKRWESPKAEGYHAPDAAWDVLDAALAAQDKAVEFALAKVDGIIAEAGRPPKSVRLRYWRSQDEYDAVHEPADGGSFRMANANSRLVASVLRLRGIVVEWV